MSRNRNYGGWFRRAKSAIVERDGINCHWCGVETIAWEQVPHEKPPPNQRTIDHVVSRACGGTNAYKNLVVACFECNQRRSHQRSLSPPISEAELEKLMQSDVG